MRRRICVEGNIGVGKSTVLEHLRLRYLDDPDVRVVLEPVEAWEEAGLLAGLYGGGLAGVGFQLAALVTRFAGLRAAEASGARVVITERSMFSDRGVFATMLLEGVDLRAYVVAYDALLAGMDDVPTSTVLLRAHLPELVRRVERRGRAAERRHSGGGVGEDYLARVEAAHDAYFAGLVGEKICVDANRSPRAVVDVVAAIVERARREHAAA